MTPIYRKSYGEDDKGPQELLIGIASWDDGSLTHRSGKFAYRDARGHIARSSPEMPIDVGVDLIIFEYEMGVLSEKDVDKLRAAFG